VKEATRKASVSTAEAPAAPAVRRGGRPRAPDIDTIVGVAAGLFDRRGFSQTTMQDLADEIGIARVTLFVQVKSKTELLEAICNAAMGEAEELLEEAAAAETAGEKIAAVLLTFTYAGPGRRSTTRDAKQRVFLSYQKHLPDKVIRSYRRRLERLVGRIAGMIEEGQHAGEFDPTIDSAAAAAAIVASTASTARWYAAGKPIGLDDLAETHVRLFLGGLRVEGFETPRCRK
jgi:AcrR family transcriptional regulator